MIRSIEVERRMAAKSQLRLKYVWMTLIWLDLVDDDIRHTKMIKECSWRMLR